MDPHLVALLNPAVFEAEPYRVLAHLVGQMHTETDVCVLAIPSPISGLAQEPKIRVLLVEADLRRLAIAKYLGLREAWQKCFWNQTSPSRKHPCSPSQNAGLSKNGSTACL